MKKWGDIIRNLTMLSQFGLSFITPLLLCLLICWWLTAHLGIGEWVFLPGFFFGLGGSFTVAYKLYLSVTGHQKKEKEKKYLVKLIQGGQYLYTDHSGETYFTAFSQSKYTKNKLEELNLEWVFDCPGIKLEEVE